MKKILDILENYSSLSKDDINKIYNDIITYYKNCLSVDDSISGYKSLIDNQRDLIKIEQFTMMNQELCLNCQNIVVLQALISIYDQVIQQKFQKFSRTEKLSIIKEYGLEELYQNIQELKNACYINKLNIFMKIPYDKLSDDIRLMGNLGFIDYDGEHIRPLCKKI